MKKLSDLTNRIVSSSASLLAVIALGTSLYEARLNREQQRAAVWPYITQGNSGEGGHYNRIVANAGIGPALVRSFQVRVRGHVVHRWSEAFDSLGVENGATVTSFLGRGTVLRAGDVLYILSLPDPGLSAAFRARVGAMETRTCYCSLYGECWTSSSEADEPVSVEACADEPKLEFGH